MGSFYNIPFTPAISSGRLRFSRAEVSNAYPFPLVRIIYLTSDDPDSGFILGEEKGIRLDLDKQLFIDHFTDEGDERAARSIAPEVARHVVSNMHSKRGQKP